MVWSLGHQLVENHIVSEALQLGWVFAEHFYEHYSNWRVRQCVLQRYKKCKPHGIPFVLDT
jgi:hypothetical protein